MNAPIIRSAPLAALLAVALAASASPALAGHAYGHGRHDDRGQRYVDERTPRYNDERDQRYVDTRVVVRQACPPPVRVIARPVACPPRVWVRPMSGVSVAFSGLIGGVAVDASVDRPMADGYAYVDPYCGITFDSLDGYAEHCWHRHPAVAQVTAWRGGCERHDWRRHDDWRDRDRYEDGE